jgi:hypothetical protein
MDLLLIHLNMEELEDLQKEVLKKLLTYLIEIYLLVAKDLWFQAI